MGPGWAIDEKRHAGTEHLDPEKVARFDEKMPFDPSGEIDVLREFGLSQEDTVVDFRTGTGVVSTRRRRTLRPRCGRRRLRNHAQGG